MVKFWSLRIYQIRPIVLNYMHLPLMNYQEAFSHQWLSAKFKGEGKKEEKESSLPQTAQRKLIRKIGSLSCCAPGGAFYHPYITKVL